MDSSNSCFKHTHGIAVRFHCAEHLYGTVAIHDRNDKATVGPGLNQCVTNIPETCRKVSCQLLGKILRA